MKESLVLRSHDYKTYEGKRLLVLLFFGITAFMLIFWFHFSKDGFTALGLLSSLFQPIMATLFLFFYIPFSKKRKITISDEGVQYESGYPKLLQKFAPDWEILWTDIKYASISKTSSYSSNVIHIPLIIHLQNKTLKLVPSQWIEPKDGDNTHSKKWIYSLFRSKKHAQYLVTNGPLVSAFRERGLLGSDIESKGKNTALSDLSSSPITITMMLYMIFAIIYFVVDLIAYKETYVWHGVPYTMITSSGLLAFALGYLLVKKISLHTYEKVSMAILVGLATSLISSQLLLRVNAWTDSDGLKVAPYILIEKAPMKSHWKSKNMQFPELIFAANAEKYWNQFSMGDIKEFQVRKGALGFYQLNLKPIEQEQKVFYE